jgi:WD40 repeat protein
MTAYSGDPAAASALAAPRRTLVGLVSESTLDPATFAAQYAMYESRGVCAAADGSGAYVGPGGAGTGLYAGGVAGSRMKRPRDQNNDASSASYLGPWAGWKGESERAVSALASGELTLDQKLVRVGQGLNPDGPGELEGEALTAAQLRLTQEKAALGDGAAPEKSKTSTSASSTATATTTDISKSVDSAGIKEPSGVTDASKGSSIGAAPVVSPAGAAAQASAPVGVAACSSTFHGGGQVDYQGRSWVAAPKGVRADGGDHECFVPKAVVRTLTGHTKGVQAVEYFPGTGHLLLSASLDGRAKIWDAAGTHKYGVKRTYIGHNGGVRSARFSADGSRFATASFDRSVKVWDTETGVARASLPTGAIAYCATWAPMDDPNVLLIGTGSRKVLQWDIREKSGPSVHGGSSAASLADANAAPELLEYDKHYANVNTVTFFDGGKSFVSTSDDKRVLVWEYNTPVPIKEFQDPSLHAVVATTAHPGGGFLVGQSMDNTLVTYSIGERMGRALKKTFKGHVTAGYACQPVFSTDGHFLASGDGDGTIWFWDWKTCRVLKSFPRVHTGGPAAGLAWHPLKPSSMASSGWDGLIKLWE